MRTIGNRSFIILGLFCLTAMVRGENILEKEKKPLLVQDAKGKLSNMKVEDNQDLTVTNLNKKENVEAVPELKAEGLNEDLIKRK